MSRENQRYFIFASWKNGRNATQIHEELVNVEGEQALSISTIRRWIATFKDGEEEIKDKARSGRPREAVTSEKIARVEDLVSNDPHTSIKELTNEVGISRERISYILHEELNSTNSVQNGFAIGFQRNINEIVSNFPSNY